ncbi:hypothetical protein AK812_SmicGene25278 [Symbiodinium microadriaticum]|uniref:Uncharacterized protein n=1 Tax=Symbiodinium microadriaticum TaxID=2951 RepID=A0A1Q9DCD5_SYMMI|nr:hypothetical protein AK812_SmicGene25278 [Symbiodinium microadriaticum]
MNTWPLKGGWDPKRWETQKHSPKDSTPQVRDDDLVQWLHSFENRRAQMPETSVLAMTATDEAGANGKVAISREMGPPVSLGITDPISLGKPTKAEEALTEQLLEVSGTVYP